jgi:hypothetical protein
MPKNIEDLLSIDQRRIREFVAHWRWIFRFLQFQYCIFQFLYVRAIAQLIVFAGDEKLGEHLGRTF